MKVQRGRNLYECKKAVDHELEKEKQVRKMNIKKLIKLSREKNPSPVLAQLSIKWHEKNRGNNPVADVASLVFMGKLMMRELCLIAFWFVILVVGKFYTSTIMMVAGVLVALFFVAGVCSYFKVCSDSVCKNIHQFIAAISLMEDIIGSPLECWNDVDKHSIVDLQKRAHEYLQNSALMLVVLEQAERTEIARIPWAEPPKEKCSKPKRDEFFHHLNLLTKLLDIPSDVGCYFGSGETTEKSLSPVRNMVR